MRRFFLRLIRRRTLRRDLETELAFHREMATEQENAIGLGNASLVKEQALDLWRFNIAENLWRDVLYAVRGLLASPTLLLSAVLSLGLAIGANTAIFQLFDAVRLRSLPVQNPQELVEVQIEGGHNGMGMNPGGYPELTRPVWEELRAQQKAFSGMFAWAMDRMNVGEGERLRNVRVLEVSGDFFRVLGVRPWRGRLISAQDESPCPPSAAVVSYAFWQNAMGAGPLGRTWMSRRGEVIGVTPPNFFGISIGDSFDIAIPLCRPEHLQSDLWDIAVVGRLRPGWTIRRASEHLKSLSTGIFAATVPQDVSTQTADTYKHFKLTTIPAAHGFSVLREQYNSSLWVLLAITGLVLLIACVNLANLLLARATARTREMAVRLALGASRARLLQQLLVEAALLAALGAAFGIALAPAFTRVVIWALSTQGNGVNLPTTLDWRVILFTACVSGAACLIFGAFPVRYLLNPQPNSALKATGRSTTASRERFLTQRALVVTQIAVSLTLLVAALLFIGTFRNLLKLDPGMRERNITVAFLAFDDVGIARDHYLDFQRKLLDEMRSTPGVINAASTTNIPLIGGSWEHGMRIGRLEGTSKFTWVSPEYFQTMGIAVLDGRGFNPTDTSSSMRVAVVNRTFVHRFLSGANPIGQVLRTVKEPNYTSTLYQIVGVIPDTKYNSIRGETPPMVFAPALQYPNPASFEVAMIHSNLPTDQLMSSIKRELARNHPGIVITGGDFQQAIRDGMVQERLMAMLSGFFGTVAVVLAVIGLYGVVSYVVGSRWSEFGIRLALGAAPRQVIGMILRQVGALVAIGTLIGIVLSLLAGRAAASLLFGLRPYDAFTIAGASMLLTVISLLASSVPARRASKVDPAIALRYE